MHERRFVFRTRKLRFRSRRDPLSNNKRKSPKLDATNAVLDRVDVERRTPIGIPA